ncbi:MAG: magnesium/cobalt transporter CorA [Planctomycetota bacterium]|nr:magnesium/cobalt transporter CorA [Planctomycetota bacterium]
MGEHTERLRREGPDGELRPPVGALPGTLVENPDALPTRMLVVDFDSEHIEEAEIRDPFDLKKYIDRDSVTWVDVSGFRNIGQIRQLGELLDIHPLALADAVNVPQRAKAEAYQDYLFIVTHAPEFENGGPCYTEQVSLLFGNHFVLTFQERPQDDLFKGLRERIRSKRGLIRGKSSAYLGYSIIDRITDEYFPILDGYETRLDALEKRILAGELDVVNELYEVKHQVFDLRRSIDTHRDSLNTLLHMQVPYLTDEVKLFLRDCHDHATSQSNLTQSLQEYAISLRELLVATQSQRMNEVMKVLTIVATIFMPLSFFAGVYGMNFDTSQPGNMPELGMAYGYWIFWGCMAAVVLSMLWYFRRRKWL